MKIPISRFPQDIIDKYNLLDIVDDGFIYCKIKQGMYSLKQAAILAYQHLVKCLKPHGYRPMKYSLGLWEHETKPTKMCLCVDDFGVKYFSKKDAEHLLDALRQYYKITVNWDGRNYCGLMINWNYNDNYVNISMPDYIQDVLKKFQHPKPKVPCHASHEWTLPAYGKRVQYTQKPDDSPLLNKKETTEIQSITGSILYYARAVDPTMLPALNKITTQQAAPTQNTQRKCKHLLDYCSTYPNAVIRYNTSDMVLHADSDAAYLVLPGAKSCIAGHFFLSTKPKPFPATPQPMRNGPILTECRLLQHV
jgi:hypothetical protein